MITKREMNFFLNALNKDSNNFKCLEKDLKFYLMPSIMPLNETFINIKVLEII